MMMPPTSSASDIANADLPLAVGPAISTARVIFAMTSVATLISSSGALDDAALDRARTALPQPDEPLWLDPGVAADIFFNAGRENDNRAVAELVRSSLAGNPVDVVVQDAEQRRKRLLVADMDSTMIGQECIDELADLVGQRARVAAITERAMRGELAFAPALRERVALLAGLPAAVIDQVIAERITLTPGGKTLVATMRASGAYTCLVSGGFTAFTNRIAAAIGFDEASANTLLVDSAGKLAGKVAEPILGREAKLATLLALRARLGIAVHNTLAVGDGANDLDMIQAAGLGVAFRAKPTVAAAAAARIDHSDLTALLFAQGYRRADFVE
jgi:phosphoserine phosphatase